MATKLTIEEIKKRLPSYLSIDESTYIKASIKAKFIDKEYGEFWAIPTNFLTRKPKEKLGHPNRNYDRSGFNKRISVEEIKFRLPPHITLDESTYTLTNNKARFIDKEYGEFWTTFTHIERGTNHPKRGLQNMKDSLTTPVQKIKEALPSHLTLVEETYKKADQKALFIDEEYGEWWATPLTVLKGKGHPQRSYLALSKARTNPASFTEHKLPPHLKLDVSTFKNKSTKCRFIDEQYGEFWAIPFNVFKHPNSGHPLRSKWRSHLEQDLAEFIGQFTKIQQNVRFSNAQKRKYECDIFLEKEKIGIEFNGLYWHSEVHKKNKYHFEKRDFFNKKGIKLIQIFENEWHFKKEIVKSMIMHSLNLSSKKCQARKLEIKPVSNLEAQTFLLNNHLMGAYRSAKYVGLYDQQELVSLIGYKIVKNGIVDISRFCNKIGTSIAGGLTRLISFIEKKEKPKEITYWIDLRYGTVDSLEKLGFKLEKISLGWKWTDFVNTYNRLHCRANMDDRKLSEKEHAKELRLFKIYDAGQAKLVKKFSY